MHISARSPLIAGTAAVVGASAVAMTPVVAPPTQFSVLDKSTVALAAFVNPIAVLSQTVQDLNEFTFSADFPFGPLDPLYYVVGSTQVGVLPQVLNGGFVPDSPATPDEGIYYFGTPALNTIGNNWSQYGLAALTGLNALTGGFGGFPVLVDAVSYIATNVFQNTVETVTRLVNGVVDVARLAVGQVVYLTQKLIGVGQAAIAALPNFESAWNIAVEGTLGPDGLLGDIVNLTQGFGRVGALEPTEDNPIGLLPSGRTSATIFTRDWAESIRNEQYIPPVLEEPEPEAPAEGVAGEDAGVAASAAAAAAVADAAPGVEDTAPAGVDEAPAVADEAPAVADEAPAVADEAPAGLAADEDAAAEAPAPKVQRRAAAGERAGSDDGGASSTATSGRAARKGSAA